MAGARFDGTAAQASLNRLLGGITNPRPLLEELGEYELRSTRGRFKTQTAPDGSAWAPLQPWYKREKRRNKERILTLNGFMRSGLVWQMVGERSVEVGSNLVQAAIHQFGGVIRPRAGKLLMFRGHVAKSVEIPARPYLGLSKEDERELVERTLDWLRTTGGLK